MLDMSLQIIVKSRTCLERQKHISRKKKQYHVTHFKCDNFQANCKQSFAFGVSIDMGCKRCAYLCFFRGGKLLRHLRIDIYRIRPPPPRRSSSSSMALRRAVNLSCPLCVFGGEERVASKGVFPSWENGVGTHIDWICHGKRRRRRRPLLFPSMHPRHKDTFFGGGNKGCVGQFADAYKGIIT